MEGGGLKELWVVRGFRLKSNQRGGFAKAGYVHPHKEGGGGKRLEVFYVIFNCEGSGP